jgi:hypothetical protein
VASSYEHDSKLDFIKTGLAELLLASQESLCTMELVKCT